MRVLINRNEEITKMKKDMRNGQYLEKHNIKGD